MRYYSSRSLALAILCSSLTATSLAQSTSTLQGTVTDSSGAVIPNAAVTVRNQDTGTERNVATDSTGTYSLPALQPGRYSVTFSASGLQKKTINDIVLEVNRTVPVNVQLGAESTSTEITVTAQAPLIESSTMTVGQVIDQRTVQQVPLNGRHFVDLGLLVAGSVTPPQSGFLTAPIRGQGSSSFNTAGNREDTVNFMINGVNLNDMVQNQITFQPSVNTVSEFKVDNSSYSAQFGRNSGAIVNIATRSGTNSFHGEVFDYLRNDYFDARNYFNRKPVRMSPFKRNNFGAALGGPIIRDKTFFFVSYEGTRQRQGLTINSGVPAAGTTSANPTIQALLGLLPAPNGPNGTTFVGSATAPVDLDQWTGDFQHTISTNDSLHGYYAYQRDQRIEPTLQGNTVPGFGDTRNGNRQILTVGETHVFGPTSTNEARLGFNRIVINFAPNYVANPSDIGLSTGNNSNIGLPQLNIRDIGLNFGGPSGFPQGRSDTTGVFSDTYSLLRGNHSFKFGGEYRRFVNSNYSGDVGSFTFNTLQNFLNGIADSFTVTPGNRPSRIYVSAVGAFAQDTWKITPRFTVELGLRFDWNGTPTEGHDRFSKFFPETATIQQVSEPYDQNYNFGPRVGFAWDVKGDGSTVVRAGYGWQADQPITNLVTPLASNPPFAVPVAITTPVSVNTAFASAAAANSVSPTTVYQGFRNAYVQSYNANVQRQLGKATALQIGYFGNKGTHLRLARNINQPINGVRPFRAVSPASPIDPGALLTNITEYTSAGNSNYNALWVTLQRSLARNLQFNTSYTWSKTLDYNSLNSQGVVLQNSYDPRSNYGPADYDAKHRWVFSGIYQVPFNSNRLVSGWQLATVVQLQSGNPFTVLTTNTSFLGTANLRPNILGHVPTFYALAHTGFIQYIPQATCATPTPGCIFQSNNASFGNEQRNSIYGPGFQNVDLNLTKDTKLTERLTLQFRADAFNIMNHPNFGQPNVFFNPTAAAGTTSTFGQISSTRFPVGDAGSSRQLQLALRLMF